MPNPIKYTTGSETLALKKGNFYIGTGDVGKGPSDTTGYYQGPNVPSGGYVIYINKPGAPGSLSYHNAANDSQLITFTNNLAGTSYTTAAQCLVYFAGQTDKVCVNRDYEGIVTNGLIMTFDAGFTPSYPTSGTTWYDISGTNNGLLTNGPTFNLNNGGSIVFDGTDDFVNVNNGYTTVMKGNDYWTISFWVKVNSYKCCGPVLLSPGVGQLEYFDLFLQAGSGGIIYFAAGGGSGSNYLQGSASLPTNTIYNLVFIKTGTSSGKVYLNSSEVSMTQYGSGLGSMPNVNADFLIGKFKQTQWELDGNIYNTIMYNRALSATEISQNYNAQKGRFGL